MKIRNNKNPQHLTHEQKQDIAKLMHISALEEMIKASSWSCKDIAFQGGTSLHLAWESPRHSEDIDFLITDDARKKLNSVMRKTAKSIQEKMIMQFPEAVIELKEPKSEDSKVANYQLKWSHPDYIGKVMTKVEFMTINQDRMNRYDNTLKQINKDQFNAVIKTIFPVARPEQIYIDKIKAIPTRHSAIKVPTIDENGEKEFAIKPRDIFDVWWLRKQYGVEPDFDKPDEFIDKLSNVSGMYTTTNEDGSTRELEPIDLVPGLADFINADPEILKEVVKEDMKRWLPDNVFSLMDEKTWKEMVEICQDDAEIVATIIYNTHQEQVMSNESKPKKSIGI